jgi:hypothetical protein
MFRISTILLLLSIGEVSAQEPQRMTAPPTGTRAMFMSRHIEKWTEGTVIRFFPERDSVCIGVYTPALRGFIPVAVVDSLQVEGRPSYATPAPDRQSRRDSRGYPWRDVPLSELLKWDGECAAPPRGLAQ